MKSFLITLALLFTCHFASVQAQTNIEVVNIENDVVSAYLQDRTYFTRTESEPFKSVIPNYFTIGSQGAKWKGLKERPNGKTISWNSSATSNVAYYAISLTDKETRTTLNYTTTPSESSFVLENLIPKQLYKYEVVAVKNDSTRESLTSGLFRTEGQLRMLNVGGVHNLRDMGGWPTSFGKTVRYGRIYRSGNLDRITKSGLAEFKGRQKVTAELDLRGESKLTESKLGPECDFIKIVAGGGSGCIVKNANLFVQDVQWIVDRLREGKNVNWHCAIGCDRCGTLSFIVGGLLGLSEIDLGRDYELSYLAGHNRTCDTPGFRGQIKTIRKYGDPGDDLAECFAKYLIKNGMSREDVNFFRDTMLK